MALPGQMGMGALFATMPSLFLPGLPAALLLPIAFIAAAAGGALPALACGFLKARWNVNEILATLVFNMLIGLLLDYLLSGPMQGFQANLPQSDQFPAQAWLPVLVSGTRIHLGLVFVLLLALGCIGLNATPLGYRLRLFGASPRLAHQAGVSRTGMIIGTMVFAGAWAGVAGWSQAAGVDHRLYATVAAPIGYTGLFAALLGRLNPLGVLLASLLLSALLNGGDYLQISAGISPEFVDTLIGFILLIIAGHSAINLNRGSR